MNNRSEDSIVQPSPFFWQQWFLDNLKSQLSPFISINPSQPILPGWVFGNSFIVNERNSSAPDTERDIVAEESYGRQLGRVIDALSVLIHERPAGAPQNQALDELETLRAKIDAIKLKSAAARLRRLQEDLEKLRKDDPESYRKILASLNGIDQPG